MIFKGLSAPITFDGSIVSLLIVRHAYDSKINIKKLFVMGTPFPFLFPFSLIHNSIFNVLLSTLIQNSLAL
jgi:hypothetical protein